MTTRNKTRIHVDHVGSIVRPAAVLRALDDVEDGKITADEWRRVADEAIVSAIRMQERVGFERVTDGEFRRRIYNRAFIDSVPGLEQRPGPFNFTNTRGETIPLMGGYATKRMRRSRPIVVDDFSFIANVATATPKATLPAPNYFHYGRPNNCFDPDTYESLEQFHEDLIAIYQEEVRALAARGCTVVQLDDVSLPLLCDPDNREKMKALGHDPERVVDLYIELNNAVFAAAPDDMTTLIHFCRGNRTGMWAGQGGYEPIAEKAFSQLDADGFLLEFDSARAGDFSPLRFLPGDKVAYLGIVSTKEPNVETADELHRRIDDASRYASLASLGICPQCGFGASAIRGFAHLNPMTEDIQERKMARMIEVAGMIWG